MTCRHCGASAWIRVSLPHGCFVFPEDRAQWLCLQHYDRLDNEHEVME